MNRLSFSFLSFESVKPIGVADIEQELYGYQVYRAENYNSKYFNDDEIINSSQGANNGYRPEWKNEIIARWEVMGEVYSYTQERLGLHPSCQSPRNTLVSGVAEKAKDRPI